MVPITPIFARNKELLILLSELLDNEREALAQLNAQSIVDLANDKKTILEELDELNTTRHSLLLKFGVIDKQKTEEGQFKHWLDQQTLYDELKQLVIECEHLLETCKIKNTANEHILTVAQQRNKSLLEILQGIDKNSRVYTAKGNTRPVSSKHTIGRA